MGKNLALSKLKNDLKQAGLLKQNSKKTRVDKKGETAAKHKAIAQFKESQVNPFDLKTTRQKHEIIGRKVKGAVGKPGVSKKKSFQVRQAKLLPELMTRNKDTLFEDKRIGENDANMSLEDKMFERFVQEQKKRASKGAFNLEQVELTHHGKPLSDFNFEPVESEDEDSGAIDFTTVKHDHFGGFSDDEKEKTKAQVMKEVIAKSKLHKWERQKLKEQDNELGLELDEQLDEIKSLMGVKGVALKSQKDSYDLFVRELASEKRAQATDRLKTEEEVALEEKEKLERLERERIERMNGVTTDSKRIATADDLDDDYISETEDRSAIYYEDGKLVDGDVNSDDQSLSEAEQSLSESENASESDGDTDSESDGDTEIIEKEEVPFVIEAPQDLRDFQAQVKGMNAEQVDTVIKRIKTLNHVKLASSNKEKLINLMHVLLEFIMDCSQKDSINASFKHLFDLCAQFPTEATAAFKSRLASCRKSFPTRRELVFFAMISKIFAVSDYKHQICIPALTYMSEILTNKSANVTLESGLEICRICLDFIKDSKRLLPEVINFLFDNSNDPIAMDLLFKYSELYQESACFMQLFDRMQSIIQDLDQFPSQVAKFQSRMAKARLCTRPLQLQKRKPIPIKQLAPKFTGDLKRKSQDSDQRVERAYKKEFKGAMRELKKDSHFIARAKTKQIQESDANYKKKMNKIMGELSNEQGISKKKF